jgi:hypothetical protein
MRVQPTLRRYSYPHARRTLMSLSEYQVRAAYNRAQRLAKRRQMMQRWADYLDELRVQASSPTVVALRRHAG